MSIPTLEFDAWQKSECSILGCTKEQHDQLIKIAGEIAAAGLGGSAYLDLAAAIKRVWPSLSEVAAQEISLADRLPPRPAKATGRPRSYQSKRSRRLHGGHSPEILR